ncbi:hypothetical protein CC78DRAFT_547362 [Lojkania enalia]|uniref:Ankyrin repeat protein n=1 Tax=Lojkania enalia TaxID=147567 RepID=A0A9P4K711_9PLEO|nr:hypothetical protein CC78DRAFT_547362 [Didymosphaeria enalia]
MNMESYPKPPQKHLKFLEESKSVDFDGRETPEYLQAKDKLRTSSAEYSGFLHTLAGLNPRQFKEYKAKDLMRWILQNTNSEGVDKFLHWRPKIGTKKTPLHQAIKYKNHSFLDCILAIADDPVKARSSLDVDVEVVTALRTRDQNVTCLHASITEKFPLKEVIQKQHRTQKGPSQEQEPDSIFLMVDDGGQTPLHLLMEHEAESKTIDSPFIRVRTPSGIPSRVEVTPTKSIFGPSIVIQAMIDELDEKMGDLWVAINNLGESPYQRRLNLNQTEELGMSEEGYEEHEVEVGNKVNGNIIAKSKEWASPLEEQKSKEMKLKLEEKKF